MYIGNKHLKQICIVIIVSMLYSCAESQKDDAVLRVEICESDEAIYAAEMVDTVSLVALKESDGLRFVVQQKENLHAGYPSGKGLRVWFPDIWLQLIGQQCGFCVRRGDTGRCPRNKAGIMGVLAVTGLFLIGWRHVGCNGM